MYVQIVRDTDLANLIAHGILLFLHFRSMPVLERATGLDRSLHRLPALMLDDFSQITPELIRQVREHYQKTERERERERVRKKEGERDREIKRDKEKERERM